MHPDKAYFEATSSKEAYEYKATKTIRRGNTGCTVVTCNFSPAVSFVHLTLTGISSFGFFVSTFSSIFTSLTKSFGIVQ